MIRPIRTEQDYQLALQRIDHLIALKPIEKTDLHDELDVLGTLVSAYEDIHHPIETVPFIDEVQLFNEKFGRLINKVPTFPSKDEMDFIYNFILEEAKELRDAYEKGDIVEVLDAILDQLYVGVGLVTMSFGLRDKILKGFEEVQFSNMSKSCKTEIEAQQTVVKRTIELQEECHYEKFEDLWVVLRTRDRKIIKSLNYHKPNLKQFFTEEEIEGCKKILTENQ